FAALPDEQRGFVFRRSRTHVNPAGGWSPLVDTHERREPPARVWAFRAILDADRTHYASERVRMETHEIRDPRLLGGHRARCVRKPRWASEDTPRPGSVGRGSERDENQR